MQRSRSLHQSLTDSQVVSHSVSRSISPPASLRSSRRSSAGSPSRQSSLADDDNPPVPAPRGLRTATTNAHERSPSPAREPPASRPSIPTPVDALRQSGTQQSVPLSNILPDGPPETPFPQIRGERLERLFFSAPEHNAQTCTVCHRRLKRQSSRGAVDDRRPFWSVGPGVGCEGQANDDEGFVEGSDDNVHPGLMQEEGKGKGRQIDKLPPQTVLSRVIRELEDDFTHFKRCAPCSKSFMASHCAHLASTLNWLTSTELWTLRPMWPSAT